MSTTTMSTVARRAAHRRGALLAASLTVCVLFTLEDPAVIASRQRLRERSAEQWWTAATIDVALAVVMVAYNYAASRFIVRTAGAPEIVRATDELAEQARTNRSVARRLDPFRLIRLVAERVGDGLRSMAVRARRDRHHRLGRVLGDLALVNVLGVPGASLERTMHGQLVDRRRTLHDALLFVGSWFVGAWCVERILLATRELPVVGAVLRRSMAGIGWTFSTLTDPTHLVGAGVLVLVLVLVVRYAVRVERLARSD